MVDGGWRSKDEPRVFASWSFPASPPPQGAANLSIPSIRAPEYAQNLNLLLAKSILGCVALPAGKDPVRFNLLLTLDHSRSPSAVVFAVPTPLEGTGSLHSRSAQYIK